MNEEGFQSNEALRVQRNAWLLAAALAPIAFAIAIFAAAPLHPATLTFAINLAALGVLAVHYAWGKNPWPRYIPVRLHADRRGATIDALTLSRAEIRDAFVLPRGARALVRIRRTRWVAPYIEIEMSCNAEARRFVRSLGFDLFAEVATFRLPSRLLAHRFRMLGVVSFAAVVFFAAATPSRYLPAPVAPLVTVALALLFILPSTLRVGVDGVLLRWMGRERFIRHDEIERLATYENGFGRSRYLGIDLLLTTGEVVKVPLSERGWEDGHVELIEGLIREAKNAVREGHPWAAIAARGLARDGRPLSDWISALETIGSGAGATHRTAPVRTETLWQILEDPAAETEVRAAAALALRPELDREGRARMLALARATAAPKVRLVFETAAGPESSEALAQALSDVDGLLEGHEAPNRRLR